MIDRPSNGTRTDNHSANGRAVTDEEIGRLVNEVASGWTTPPGLTLRIPDWQERIAARRTWRYRLRPVLAGASLALAGVVVFAFAAIWLGAPRAAKMPPTASGSGTPSDRSTPAALMTPLPKLAVFGGPAPDLQPIVGMYPADAIADLATGTLLQPLHPSGSQDTAQLFRQADGSLIGVTIAVTYGTANATKGVDSARVSLSHIDSAGTASAAKVIASYTSAEWTPISTDDPPGVSLNLAFDKGSGTLFIGWAKRATSVWQSGIDVVPVSSGSVTQTVRLPDVTPLVGGHEQMAWPPQVRVAPDGAHLVASGAIIVDFQANARRWSAPFGSGRIGALTPSAASTDGCGGIALSEGFLTSSTYYTLCTSPQGSTMLRTLDLSGNVLANATLPGSATGAPSVTIDPATHAVYSWDPATRTLVRVDAATGRETGRVTAPAPAASTDPVTALAHGFARWIAPVAEAKMFLDPATALSPDGRTLYALGATGDNPETRGSEGIYVFDVAAMRYEARWLPTADFNSIAVSPDGRYVLAAGMPGVDASGTQANQQASVTVYDSGSGAVRAVAGQLTRLDYLTFRPDSLR